MTTLMSSGRTHQSRLEILRLFIAGDQAAQPGPVQGSQPFARFVPMTLVGIHAADQHIILQDQCRRDVGYGPGGDTAGSDSRQADDPARSDLLDRVSKHRSNPRTLDDDVRLEADT